VISAEHAEQLVARMKGWVVGIVLSLDRITFLNQKRMSDHDQFEQTSTPVDLQYEISNIQQQDLW
jgi:hypothetical protein